MYTYSSHILDIAILVLCETEATADRVVEEHQRMIHKPCVRVD